MLKTASRFYRMISLLLVLCLLAASFPIMAFAAEEKPTVRFSGTVSSSKLVVAVSLNNPNTSLDSGMFLLKYDTNVLTASSSAVSAQSPAKKSAVYFNASSGYIGLDWHYPIRLASTDSYSDVALITFGIKSGKTVRRLDEVISVCTNKDWLEDIGGYQNDGGLLLCSGNNVLTAAGGRVSANFSLSSAARLRLGGSDRFATSALISEEGWSGGSDAVIIANGIQFADALAGVPLAAALNAPILLVAKNSVSSSVKAEVARLGASKVYILGGIAAIDKSVENSFSGVSVERLAGSDRFATAVAIAEKLQEITGRKPSNVFLASAVSFPDALAVSPVAGMTLSPILYAPKTGTITAVTSDYIKASGAASVTVLGGTAVINTKVQNSAKVGSVASVTRISGDNRYQTALRINQKYDSLFATGTAAFATGLAFPDALAGGALAAKLKLPLVLADTPYVTNEMKSYVSGRDVRNVYIFGGSNAVPDSLCTTLLG